MATRRAIAALALLAYAALALGSGLDRISERRAAVAGYVPGPFSANAARTLALAAIVAGNGQSAIDHARAAVAADPADARSLGLLGQGYLLAGKPRQARRWFAAAGRLGWREPFTQAYWMANAIDARDFAGASVRLDALLRQFPYSPYRGRFLALFEDDEGGRAALASRLSAGPAWARAYFSDGAAAGDRARAARIDIAQRLARQHHFRDCAMVMPLVQKGVESAAVATAHTLWQAHCAPGGVAQLPYDGEFERTALEGPRAFFEWTFPADGALAIDLAPVSGLSGMALTASNSAPGERAVATQLLPLTPGAWTVGWRTAGRGDAVNVALDCHGSPRSPRPGEPLAGAPGRYRARFTIAEGCAGAWLSFGVAAGARDVSIDEVSIRPG